MSKIRILIIIALISLFISSYVIILIPFSDFGEGGFKTVLSYCISICFYLFLILGYILFIVANQKRKKQKLTKKNRYKLKPGIIVFFSSLWGSIADIILIMSVVMVAMLMIFPNVFSDLIKYILIATFIFSVHMHSIFNGVNYRVAFLLSKTGDCKIKDKK